MRIVTLPVFSKLADPAAVYNFFGREMPVALRQHQLATAQALADPDTDIVINTALTGDGKSLAARLDTFAGPPTRNLLALYPTNDLTNDQFQQDTNPAWMTQWSFDPRAVERLSSALLDELTESFDTPLSRPEALLSVLNRARLLLTNPDMFHAMVQFNYQQYGRDPAHIAGRLTELFERIVADEFHCYDAAQVTALLTGLIFLYEQKAVSQKLKTLLLSATPTPWVLRRLDAAGFAGRWQIVDPVANGWYAHGSAPDTSWTPILRGADLHLVPTGASDWMPAGIETVLAPWFSVHRRAAKAAVIVNSVATAQRLVAQLQERLGPQGLTIGSTTGLDDRPTRAQALQADVLVGTSTVDVGVDFKINLLIFEAPTAATFGQRFGRLGRHDGYTDRHGMFHTFSSFAAYALVPPFVYERLTLLRQNGAPALSDGMTLDRVSLGNLINSIGPQGETIYPQQPQFHHYMRHWGRFVPAGVLNALSGKQTTGLGPGKTDRQTAATFSNLHETLWRRYGQFTQTSMKQARADWRAYNQDKLGGLVREAQSFRGASPLQCGVLREGHEPVSYDLLWLLRNAEMEWLTRNDFLQELRTRRLPIRPFERDWHCGYGRLHGFRETREEPELVLFDRASGEINRNAGRALMLDGFQVNARSHSGLFQLNKLLAGQAVVATCVPDIAPDILRQRIYLPGMFPLAAYRFADALGGGTIAFGRAALLLDSELRYRPFSAGSPASFIL